MGLTPKQRQYVAQHLGRAWWSLNDTRSYLESLDGQEDAAEDVFLLAVAVDDLQRDLMGHRTGPLRRASRPIP